MPKKILPLVGGLIALYLVVAYSKGTANLIDSSTKGAGSVIKILQARG